jgi:hypothetical protein
VSSATPCLGSILNELDDLESGFACDRVGVEGSLEIFRNVLIETTYQQSEDFAEVYLQVRINAW